MKKVIIIAGNSYSFGNNPTKPIPIVESNAQTGNYYKFLINNDLISLNDVRKYLESDEQRKNEFIACLIKYKEILKADKYPKWSIETYNNNPNVRRESIEPARRELFKLFELELKKFVVNDIGEVFLYRSLSDFSPTKAEKEDYKYPIPLLYSSGKFQDMLKAIVDDLDINNETDNILYVHGSDLQALEQLVRGNVWKEMAFLNDSVEYFYLVQPKAITWNISTAIISN